MRSHAATPPLLNMCSHTISLKLCNPVVKLSELTVVLQLAREATTQSYSSWYWPVLHSKRSSNTTNPTMISSIRTHLLKCIIMTSLLYCYFILKCIVTYWKKKMILEATNKKTFFLIFFLHFIYWNCYKHEKLFRCISKGFLHHEVILEIKAHFTLNLHGRSRC